MKKRSIGTIIFLTELPRVKARTPDMTAEEVAKVKPVLNETYGKVVYFWQLGNPLPIGEPKAVIIEDILSTNSTSGDTAISVEILLYNTSTKRSTNQAFFNKISKSGDGGGSGDCLDTKRILL